MSTRPAAPPDNGGSLGSNLKAFRLGYGYLRPVRAFVRISDAADGFRCDVVPPDAFPSGRQSRHMKPERHRCWWEASSDPSLPAEIAQLLAETLAGSARLKRVRRPVSILFTDEGRFVRWETP